MVATDPELPIVRVAPSADAIPLKLRRMGGGPRQVLAAVAIGTLALAVFASRDLSTWLERMGDGPLLMPLQHAAAVWDGAMTRIGLTGPNEALRNAIRVLL